jgi:malate synthase
MGGMAAQIPIKNDPAQNELALEKVRADKTREVSLGHDGTWVAHPGLVPIAREIFDSVMPQANQIQQNRDSLNVTVSDLLQVPSGDITQNGLRLNVSVAVEYLEAWLRGSGCVPLRHLMEDAATAEISRAQIWQWLKHDKIQLSDFKNTLSQELQQLRTRIGDEAYITGKYDLAGQLLTEITTSQEFVEFLTLPAYSYL